MNPPRPAINQILGGLGAVAGSSLFRAAVKNWWITAPMGYAAYVLLKERHRKKELTIPNVISDLAPMASLVATLVILNNTLEQREGQSGVTAAQPIGPTTDASFTPNTRHADEPVSAVPLLTGDRHA